MRVFLNDEKVKQLPNIGMTIECRLRAKGIMALICFIQLGSKRAY